MWKDVSTCVYMCGTRLRHTLLSCKENMYVLYYYSPVLVQGTRKQTSDREEEEMERWRDRALSGRERGQTSNSANLQEKKEMKRKNWIENNTCTPHFSMDTYTHAHKRGVLFPRPACADRTPALTFICAHAPAHAHCYFSLQHQTSVFLPQCDVKFTTKSWFFVSAVENEC